MEGYLSQNNLFIPHNMVCQFVLDLQEVYLTIKTLITWFCSVLLNVNTLRKI